MTIAEKPLTEATVKKLLAEAMQRPKKTTTKPDPKLVAALKKIRGERS